MPASTEPERIAVFASPPPECATYLVCAGSAPSTRASSPSRIWSVLPAEPPATRTEPGIALEIRGEVLQRLVLRLRRDDDRLGLGDQRRDRDRGVEADVGLVRLDRAEHHVPGHHQLVRVAGVLGDELREPERSAGALDVVDLDPVIEVRLARRGLEGAAGAVPAAAGRGRGHDPHLAGGVRLGRVVAGRAARRRDRDDGGDGQRPLRSRHAYPSPTGGYPDAGPGITNFRGRDRRRGRQRRHVRGACGARARLRRARA